jgi:hypothetical protein
VTTPTGLARSWAPRARPFDAAFGLAVLVIGLGTAAASVDAAQPSELRSASVDQIARYVLAVTRDHFRVLSGTPVVSLVRRTDAAELESFGLGPIHLYCGEPPMVLAIISGDLELAYAPLRPPGAPPVRTDAVAYVFVESNGREMAEIVGHSRVEPLRRAASTAPPRSGSGRPRMPAQLPTICTQGGFAPGAVPSRRMP